MAERVRPEFLDLGGGLNEGASPSALRDSEFTLLENFFPFDTKLIRRNGTLRISSAPYTVPLTGFFSYRDPDAGTTYILGDASGFSRFDVLGAFTDIPAFSIPSSDRDATIPSSDLPWHFLQNGKVIYGIRGDGETGLMRLEFNGYSLAGIEPPAAAATIADGGAGVLTASDRQVVYTFRNSVTGAESNASPVSNTLALAADRAIAVTAIAISDDPQVNQRRVYGNVPGTLGAYLLIGSIDDNLTTTFTWNITTAQLGALIGEENAVPPEIVLSGDVHAERLFVTDGLDVLYSEQFKYESFSEFSVMEDFRQFGRLNTIYSDGTSLWIAGLTSLHKIEGISTFKRNTLSKVHGCHAPLTMKGAEGLLFFYGGDDFYRSDGLNIEGIGSLKIKKILARIPTDLRPRMTAAIFPKYSWYLIACPVSGEILNDAGDTIDEGLPPTVSSTINNLVIGYNYRSQAWFTFKWAGDAPYMLIEAPDFDGKLRLFALFYDNHIYRLDYGRVDQTATAPQVITAKFRTKAHKLGRAGMLSGIKRVLMKMTSLPAASGGVDDHWGSIGDLYLYRDENSTPIKSKLDVPLDDPAAPRDIEWKAFKMSTMGELGALWQFQFDYADQPPIEIEGLAFEGVALNRDPRAR